jgi:hypothetical protein
MGQPRAMKMDGLHIMGMIDGQHTIGTMDRRHPMGGPTVSIANNGIYCVVGTRISGIQVDDVDG